MADQKCCTDGWHVVDMPEFYGPGDTAELVDDYGPVMELTFIGACRIKVQRRCPVLRDLDELQKVFPTRSN